MAGNKISVRALESDGLGLKAMADSDQPNNFQETLKPFYQRASAAEDRLSKLEATLAGKKDAGNEEYLKTISDLQSKLEDANSKAEKLAAEIEKLKFVNCGDAQKQEQLKTITDLLSKLEDANAKVEKLAAENEKHKYRMKHIIRALREADQKLESMSAPIRAGFSNSHLQHLGGRGLGIVMIQKQLHRKSPRWVIS